MSDFPQSAAAIWIGPKGELRLGLPAAAGHQTSHSVILRADASGMAQLIQILSARLQEATASAKIGCKAVPTQALADALLRSQRYEQHKASREEARRVAGLTQEQLLEEISADFFEDL